MCPSTAIEKLSDAALRRLLERYVYQPDATDQRRRALEFTVEEAWADGLISTHTILETLEEETEANSQFLIGAELRAKREAA